MKKSLICSVAAIVIGGVALGGLSGLHKGAGAASAAETQIPIDGDDIAGVVTSARGPEAGVWVIAETKDLPVAYRKIVVTDDRGRYLLPDLQKAKYRVWVRGYGLVDSPAVQSAPGARLNLKAVIAPDARAAAQYYPANYWYSLLELPSKVELPKAMAALPPGERGFAGGPFPLTRTQDDWAYGLKRGCESCHQMGNKATREIPKAIGTFASSKDAWQRRILSGQTGLQMLGTMDTHFGREGGLKMFADWTDRIAAGEVPAAPPRPQGVERNVVITEWDYGTDRSFVHDIIATNKFNPTQNANGPIYGPDWSAGAVAYLDPVKNVRKMIPVPIQDENDRKDLRTWSAQQNAAPSPYWGDEIVWDDRVNPNQPHMDDEGRIWFSSQTRAKQPAFCTDPKNPFAKNWPLAGGGKGSVGLDPKTGKFELIDTCFGQQHSIFDLKHEVFYATGGGGVGWTNIKTWAKTHDPEKSQGWCPAIIDYNGDGKIGAFTTPDQPADPKLDRQPSGTGGYAINVNPVDGSVWWTAGVIGGPYAAVPGKIIRTTPGAHPPETCMTEVYEPPYNNPEAKGQQGWYTQGADIDSNGVVWVALNSMHVASFDRRKCKVLRGPTATGQHCPEGWALYPVPGPTFKNSNVKSDYYYFNWVDRFNILGLGKDAPITNGTGSDSLIVLQPETKKFVTLRVPYPLGFYTRGMDGRIDDPKAGWKGRGIWAANNTRVVWHSEGGKGSSSMVAHFQVRPSPLAK